MFSRSLHGSMIEYQHGPWHFKGLYSETKGTAQTVSIPGSNSEGPYFLESGRVLPDTLSVMVDGVLQRPGTDYVLNSESSDSGSITFLDHVIPPTSTIVATFESVSPGSSPGILTGAAATYNLGKVRACRGHRCRAALDRIERRRHRSRDLFVFAGAASPMYLLSYQPIVCDRRGAARQHRSSNLEPSSMEQQHRGRRRLGPQPGRSRRSFS